MPAKSIVPHTPSSEITSESAYLNRRELMKASMATLPLLAGGAAVSPALGASAVSPLQYSSASDAASGFDTKEAITPYDAVTAYNNFYEFGTDKGDPARYAHEMSVDPWSVEVVGEVNKPGKLHLEDLVSRNDLEERIYRLRCVEAWSMVIPWVGFPLANLLAHFDPTSKAKYVSFETLYDRKQMRGTRSRTGTIDWPYREGLRIDEAMHPLTIMSVGLFGKTMPNQNGAPIRLVVPWKYGFKSIKSVVRIRLTQRQPRTSWNTLGPAEYGFYSNVNPDVDHPRWSQKSERRLPSTLFRPNRIPTQRFNGYEEQVAGLYKGMDLRKFY